MQNQKKMSGSYFDYASTTPLDAQVVNAMMPFYSEKFGNSATLYRLGRDAREKLEESREVLASTLGVKSQRLILTSSATESNNLALKGVAFANRSHGKHIIVSAIEHESILAPARWLEGQGFDVSYIPVNKNCHVDPKDVEKALRDDTILVSIMHANNEVGAIQPIRYIGKVIEDKVRHYKLKSVNYKLPLFHTDAAQTFGKISTNPNTLGVDLLTASSHKIYGPKGAAMLYVGSDVNIEPIMHGGGHERGLRSSTVNVGAMAGFAEAARVALTQSKEEYKRQEELSDIISRGILASVAGATFNCNSKKRIPSIMSLSFSKVSGEELLFALDNAGFAVSIASGCSSITLELSHVLLACGISREQAMNTIRVSTGKYTSEEDARRFVKAISECVEKIRRLVIR